MNEQRSELPSKRFTEVLSFYTVSLNVCLTFCCSLCLHNCLPSCSRHLRSSSPSFRHFCLHLAHWKLAERKICFCLCMALASSPGNSQILSHSHGENREKYKPSPPFPVRDVVLLPGLLPIFLHGCEIKSGSGLGTMLTWHMTAVLNFCFKTYGMCRTDIWKIHH